MPLGNTPHTSTQGEGKTLPGNLSSPGMEGKSYTFSTLGVSHEKVEKKGKPDEFFVHGYISTEDIDAVHDLVTRGALEDMLKQIKGKPIPVKIDVEHETINKETGEVRHFIPVGKVVDGRLDSKGLWVKVKLNTAIKRFGEIWGSVKNGNLDAFSITFRVKDFTERMINGIKTRLIHSLDLINVALTGTPINPAAAITEVFAKAVRDGGAPIEEKQGDPKRICGDIWFNGTEKQRGAFGSGTQGRGRDKKPPKAWWDDCLRTIRRGSKGFDAKGLNEHLNKLMEAKDMGDEKTKEQQAAADAEAKAKADAAAQAKAEADKKAAEEKVAADKAEAEKKAAADTESKAITELKAQLDALETKNTALETELKAIRELPILKAAAPAEPAAPEAKGTGTEQKSASPMSII